MKDWSFFFLLLSLFSVWFAVIEASNKCHDNDCCLDKENPNPTTGQGYLQFKRRCLDGGLHCVGNSGCELCRKDNVADKFRPVCDRFKKKDDKDDKDDDKGKDKDDDKGKDKDDDKKGKKKCYGEDCCMKMRDDHYSKDSHLEYYRFCHWGEDDYCLDRTGCRWCRKKGDFKDPHKPVCKRYKDDDGDDGDKDKKCHDDECCEKIEIFGDHLEYDKRCLWGEDDYCFDKTGCRWCRKDHEYGDPHKPICKRHKDDKKKKCFNDHCCEKMQPYGGYLEYDAKCLWGEGGYCFEKTGCRWCRSGYGHEDPHKPLCERYKKDDDDKDKDDKDDKDKKCHDDRCCEKIKFFGEYLEFDKRCLWGGKNCYEKTGCCWCRKKHSHDYSRPICQRYDH